MGNNLLSLIQKTTIFFLRWRAQQILSRIPKHDWPQMKLKITAASILMNKRYDFGLKRKWEGNYLSSPSENLHYTVFNDSVNNLKNSKHFNTVLFSCFVTKFNKFNKVSNFFYCL